MAFQYNNNGNLTAITNENGQTTRYSYNDNGQILQATDPEGHTAFGNEYDASGRIVKQTDALGFSTTVQYDEETEPGRIITTYSDRNGIQKKLIHDGSYRG